MRDVGIWRGDRRQNPLTRTLDAVTGLWDNRSRRPQAPFRSDNPFQSMPSIEVSEDEKEVTVRAEIPGLSQKDLDLSYLDGVLYLRGEKKQEHEDKKRGTYYRESWYGSFSRSIPVGTQVDWEQTKAHYKDGVLHIALPKKEGAAKKINIDIQG